MPCSQAVQQAADSTLAGFGSSIALGQGAGSAATWWGRGFACRVRNQCHFSSQQPHRKHECDAVRGITAVRGFCISLHV